MNNNIHLNQAFLSLGSNIDPETNLRAAIEELAHFGRILKKSSVWENPSIGPTSQPDYLNAALLLETALTAQELKTDAIAYIENKLGRVRTNDRFSSRTIDIDIMLFNHDRICLAHRRIPDQEIMKRGFVAIPLAEIAPDFLHPDSGESLAEIAARFDPETAGMHRRDDICL